MDDSQLDPWLMNADNNLQYSAANYVYASNANKVEIVLLGCRKLHKLVSIDARWVAIGYFNPPDSILWSNPSLSLKEIWESKLKIKENTLSITWALLTFFFLFFFLREKYVEKKKKAISTEGAQVGQQNQPIFLTDNGNGYASMAS